MQGLSGLVHLAKLYLQVTPDSTQHLNLEIPAHPVASSSTIRLVQGNRISLVEGLTGLASLEELHLSGQRLPPDCGGLTFELRSMASVSSTLRVLCAVDCGITDTAAAGGLPPLPQLRKLDLSNNNMEVIEVGDASVVSRLRFCACSGPEGVGKCVKCLDR